jgi:hypothetical protein
MAQCRSWGEAEVHIDALQARCGELERRLRHAEKQLDTLGSPWWKRLAFRLNGWPPWWIVADRPAWRPWHRQDS